MRTAKTPLPRSSAVTGSDAPTVLGSRLATDGVWREDVALEMWVNSTSDIVAIRLEGALDGATGFNLTEVVRDCQADGACDFTFQTGALRMERSGWSVMKRLREQIRAAGGQLRWDSSIRAAHGGETSRPRPRRTHCERGSR